MPWYSMNDATVELPDDPFLDRSVHRLDARAHGQDVVLRVHRRPREDGRTLKDICTADVAKAARSLPSFHVVGADHRGIGGVSGLELAFQWRGRRDVVYTHQAHALRGDTWLTISANASLLARDACVHCVETVAKSFHFIDRDSDAPDWGYRMNDAIFRLPDLEFVDRTHTLLEVDAPGGSLEFSIERRALEGRALGELFAIHRAQEPQPAGDLSIAFEREIVLDRHVAWEVSLRRRLDGKLSYVRQAHAPRGDTWLAIAVEAPAGGRDDCDRWMISVLETLRGR